MLNFTSIFKPSQQETTQLCYEEWNKISGEILFCISVVLDRNWLLNDLKFKWNLRHTVYLFKLQNIHNEIMLCELLPWQLLMEFNLYLKIKQLPSFFGVTDPLFVKKSYRKLYKNIVSV